MQRLNQILTRTRSVCNVIRDNKVCYRVFSSENTVDGKSKTNGIGEDVKSEEVVQQNLSGFAKSFQKHENILNKPIKDTQTFAEMLRYSKFIDLGDPAGKIVTGKIYHVVGDDLYIDFGWKFPCVCQKPLKNGEGYVRDAIVKLKINDLELSTKFLGAEKELTLLEADCTLLGLVTTPFRSKSHKQPVINELINKN